MRTIDAEALKKALDEQMNFEENCRDSVFDIIDDAPTVEQNWKFYYDHGYKQAERDLKRPQGEWEFDSEYTEFGNPYGTYKCSCCGGHSSDKYPYCFWCGAEMRKEEDK